MIFELQVAAQLLLLSVSTVFGFSKGPPLSACENKFPHHKRAVAQQGLPPYNISVSSLLYNPGDNLTVIISGSQPFKGFILNAQGTESSIPRPVGTFTQIPSYTASLDCSGDESKDTVGHKNPNPAKNLNSLQFTWMAPEKSAGNISFIATIVQSYSTFWEKVSSPVVHGPPAEDVTSGTSTESFQSQKITKDGCGKTKSCYSEPANCKSSKDCEYLVTIKPEGDQCESVEFELSTKKQWGAIGFNSEKNKMDGTDALICAEVKNNVTVEHYMADQGYGRPTKTTPTPASIIVTLAESKDGVVACRFKRKKKDDKMVDLTKTWHLVYASGPMSGDKIGIHSTTPKTSPQKVDVCAKGELVAAEKSITLVQVHGCLMVIAWIGFASIGMFIARHMKVLFGQRVLLGTKMWFTLHRLLMALTVVLTILGVILIFVHAGRWTKEAGAHPITGIFVLVLAVIQPIMAVFRPHPGEEKRYIFNWAHRGVGLSALILAVVTVFFGLRLPHSRLGDPALYPMVAYCVALILVVAYDIYDTLTTSRGGASFNVGPSGGKEGDYLCSKEAKYQSELPVKISQCLDFIHYFKEFFQSEIKAFKNGHILQ